MEFSWITTFLTAAKCENFRRTAELLYISQPSVTVHIRNLEKELGIELFERDGRNIKLTEEGRRYIHHAKNILHAHEQGLRDLQSFRQGYSDKLTLAISPLMADTILPFVLKAFMKAYPHVEVSVKVMESIFIETEVLEEQIDIGLSCLDSSHPNLFCHTVYTDQVKLIAPHDGADVEIGFRLDEEDVLQNSVLLTHNHPVYWEPLISEVKHFFPSIKMMRVSQTHVTKRFIVEGLGVSFLPESIVRRELLEGWLLDIPCTSIQLPTATTFALMKYEHSKQREFLRFLLNYRI